MRRHRIAAALVGAATDAALATPVAAIYDSQTVLAGGGTSTFAGQFELSPDGRFAVFVADRDNPGVYELYSARLDGTANTVTKLSTPNVGGNVFSFVVAPDSSRVIYRGDLRNDDVFELFSAPLDTPGDQTLLSATPATGSDVFSFMVAPDSSRVIYTGDLRTDQKDELFAAPLDTPGGQTVLSATPGTNGNVFSDYAIAPDSSRVIYRGDLRNDQVVELFSAPLDTPAGQTLLSATPTTDGDVFSFEVAPDSSRVIYLGDLRDDLVDELFSAPLDTPGGQTPLSAADIFSSDGVVADFVVAPDSSRVIYTGNLNTGLKVELFSAPLDTPNSQTLLSETDFFDGDVADLVVAPDSSRVIYTGDLRTNQVFELFSAPLDTPNNQTLLSATVANGNVTDFAVAPDSSRVIYRGDLRTVVVFELFSAPLDTPNGQTLLSATPVTGGAVFANFVVAPDSSRVIYLGDLRTDDVYELFSAPLDTPNSQTVLSTNPVTGGDIFSFVAAPDSSRVIYRGDLRTDDVFELLSAPLDTPNGQTLLSAAPVTGGDVFADFAVAPDSSHVVYHGDLRTDGVLELYASGVGQLPSRAVTGLTATAVATDTVTLTWTRPAFASQVISYRIDVDPTARRTTATVDGDTTTVTMTGLAPDTAHTATVVAVNDAGDSPAAATTFTTDPTDDPTNNPTDDPTDDPTNNPTDDPTDNPTDEPTDEPTDTPTPEPAGVLRLSGETRYDTAAAAALDRFDPDDVEVVYLATGRNFPDALAGGPLAAQVGAPILLVEPDSLPEITASTLATLNPSTVIALGGTVAVSDDVLAAAGAAAGATTDRLAGDNRYATAVAIADALIAAGGDTSRAFLAIGTNFPDAVAAGPATNGAPILLTPGTALAHDTGTWLTDNMPATVTAVGGEAVLTKSVLDAAGVTAGGTSTRLAGDSRYATAIAIAATLGTPDTVYVAVGTNYPDALTGGPAAAAEGAPIVLVAGGTDTLPPDTAAYLDNLPALRRIVVLGGTTVVPDAILTELQTLLD